VNKIVDGISLKINCTVDSKKYWKKMAAKNPNKLTKVLATLKPVL